LDAGQTDVMIGRPIADFRDTERPLLSKNYRMISLTTAYTAHGIFCSNLRLLVGLCDVAYIYDVSVCRQTRLSDYYIK